MGTLLTTPKMAPALRARIEDSVRGRRRDGRGRAARVGFPLPLVLVVRFSAAFAVVAVVVATVYFRRQDRMELERLRASLLHAVELQSASVTQEDTGRVTLIRSWLTRLSGAYEGDLIADQLR